MAKQLIPDSEIKQLAYNTNQAAKALGVSRTWIWRKQALGKIRKAECGLFPHSEIERILKIKGATA